MVIFLRILHNAPMTTPHAGAKKPPRGRLVGCRDGGLVAVVGAGSVVGVAATAVCATRVSECCEAGCCEHEGDDGFHGDVPFSVKGVEGDVAGMLMMMGGC